MELWLILKKTYLVGWVTLTTLYGFLAVYFNLWTKPRAEADAANRGLTMWWGKRLMNGLGVQITTQGAPISKEATLFVGNHMSYIDIPVFYTLRNATFVAKKEVASWPIFGPATSSVGTIFVERESIKSRVATTDAMRAAILDRKQSIVIFPEGTSSVAGKTWRAGALRMAADADLVVQPFVIYYRPTRIASYIDDDNFVKHLWQWVASHRIEATIHFFEPRKVTDAHESTREIQELVQSKWREIDARN